MKRLILAIAVVAFMAAPAHATFSSPKATASVNKSGNSHSKSTAVGINSNKNKANASINRSGNSRNKNTVVGVNSNRNKASVKNSGNSRNKNTNVGINKNSNSNRNANRNTNVGINKNKNKNTNTNNVNTRVSNQNRVSNNTNVKNKVSNNTNVNASSRNKNSNKQGQQQGQEQSNRQGQDQYQRASSDQDQGQSQGANNDQVQSANNEGINIDASDNSSYSYTEADNIPIVAPTFPMSGTTSFTFSTPFGGGGMSKDTKDAKLISTGSFVMQARDAKLLDEDDAKEATLNIVNRLLRISCGRKCVIKEDKEVKVEDKEITGNGGNL